MGYASRSGRAQTSSKQPRAFGVCDRCSFWYNHDQLSWQYDWAGASLLNKRILVCRSCYDEPQQQLRAIVVPADPMPIINPRTEPYNWDNTDSRQISGYNTVNATTGIPVPGGDTRVTSLNNEDDGIRVTQQTGEPPYGVNQLPGTDPNAVTYRTITNCVNNGSGLARLTVATTNGMITGQHITVQEVGGVDAANGNWVATVIDNTTVDLQGTIFSGTYTSGGYLVNNPSLPYGFDEIPRTGAL
jgi:hypothetical protein